MTTTTHRWDILQVILSTGREAHLQEKVFYDKDELIPVRCSALEFEFCVRLPGGHVPGESHTLHLDECPERVITGGYAENDIVLSLRLIDADDPYDFEKLDEQDGRYDAWA